MTNKPKTLDNSVCMGFLGNYLTMGDLCDSHPRIDDILTGILGLSTENNTSTRTLSRQVLFLILTQLEVITTSHVDRITGRKYADRTIRVYTQVARITSKAITQYMETLHPDQMHPTPSVWQSRQDLDNQHRPTEAQEGQKYRRAEWWLPVGTSHAQSIDQRPMLAELKRRLPKLYSQDWDDCPLTVSR